MGAWVLDTLWAKVRARINRADSVAMKRKITDAKISPVPNAHYARLRPETALPGIGNDEDFGNISESAATIAILKRNLRQVRMILIAIILKFPEAEQEKFWRWEPGFGFQVSGTITNEKQSVTFKTSVASSPADMWPTDGDIPARPRPTVFVDRARASTPSGGEKPRSPSRKRGLSAPRSSGEAMPEPTSAPMSYGGGESSTGAQPSTTERSSLRGLQEQ
eukprot:3663455-Amphidinium_carterae.3